MATSASPEWERLLVAYLSGNADFTDFYNSAKRPLERIVRRVAPWLPKDLHEDVVQQLFVRLWANPPQYDRAKCSGRILAFGLLRNALKQVRSMFAVPGTRTRPQQHEFSQISEAPAVDAEQEELTEPVSNAEKALHIAESSYGTASTIEATVITAEFLQAANWEVAAGALLVYGSDYSVTEAANRVGTSRFALRRGIDSWMKALRDQQQGRIHRAPISKLL